MSADSRPVTDPHGAPDPRPILFVDVDGVISLYGFPGPETPPGRFHLIDGLHHCIGRDAGRLLARLADAFELVWATGWEHRANEYLPDLLDLPGRELPTLVFDEEPMHPAHWKLSAIDRYAGDRPAAWIDDALDERCERWARERSAPVLLVKTDPAAGISEEDVERLLAWAEGVSTARKART